MRLTRLTVFTMLIAAAVSTLQSFPSSPSERAAVVCRPVRFMVGVASAISASMNDSGRIGRPIVPWHDNVHRACLRVAEDVFIAAAEP